MQAIIIHPYLKHIELKNNYTISYKIEEAIRLAKTIDLEIFEVVKVPLNKVVPATYIGGGKVDELKTIISANKIPLIIFNDVLTPIQQRNLEKVFNSKVIDRTALIIEIFASRARTNEGILQVELASQEYQKSRLVRSWTHLERQRGGTGGMGGPGEKQIESDRRAIAEKILKIKRQLEKVVNRRDLHRKARRKVPYPIVVLVGYTNAGKSTLFNLLTKADVLAEDKLFATLDPTMRMLKLPSGRKIILSDTVGFISNLPTELVAAFRATLEEVSEADLLIHVRDIAHDATEEQKQDVLDILTTLLSEDRLQNNVVEVLNKTDLLDKIKSEHLQNLPKTAIAISALKHTGIEDLFFQIDRKLGSEEKIQHLDVQMSDGKQIAWLYNNSDVLERVDNHMENTIHMTCKISDKLWGIYQKSFLLS